MMLQEITEGAVSAISEGNVLDTSGTLTKVVLSFLITAVLGLGGWLMKRQRSANSLEDRTNDLTVETLESARAYMREQDTKIEGLQGQVQAMLGEVQKATLAQIQSEGAAQRAAIQASLAGEASERAQEAAARAREEATEARRLLTITQAYVRQLRSAMIAAGIEPPPEPTI